MHAVVVVVVVAVVFVCLQGEKATETGVLQAQLDAHCRQKCMENASQKAKVACKHVSARYLILFVGFWSCYSPGAMDKTKKGFYCVNDCGQLFACGDGPNSDSVYGYGEPEVLASIVRKNRYKWCQVDTCVKPVQTVLNDYCREALRFLCPPHRSECSGGAIARKDVGGLYERKKEWRCYNPSQISPEASTAFCLKKCEKTEKWCLDGVPGGISKEHWNLTTSLESVIQANAVSPQLFKTVGKLQQKLDLACSEEFWKTCPREKAECAAGSVARKEHITDKKEEAHWGCYRPSEVSSSLYSSLCVGECGHEVPCGKGVTVEPRAEANIDFEKIVNENMAETCGHGPAKPVSSLQRLLDDYCKESLRDICQGTFCPYGAVARKEMGNTDDEEQKWRCYNSSNLSSEGEAICVDDCGQEIPCGDGVVWNLRHGYWTREVQIQKLIRENKKDNCRANRSSSLGLR